MTSDLTRIGMLNDRRYRTLDFSKKRRAKPRILRFVVLCRLVQLDLGQVVE